MPYITQIRRSQLEQGDSPQNTGELNYTFYKICLGFIKEHGKRYTTMSQCMAALRDCAAEFYRREVAPYEDTKIQENGDVTL